MSGARAPALPLLACALAVGLGLLGCSTVVATEPTEPASSQGGGPIAGSGGAGGSFCTPGDSTACYTGPKSTMYVAGCKPGIQHCVDDGSAWGPCEDEVLPVPETCATPFDDDCNGEVNEGGEGCACEPGSTAICYSGPPSTLGQGPCVAGTQTCIEGGTGFGPCVGEILPAQESCATPEDDDCDGLVNEAEDGCVCEPGTTAPCYSGPVGTDGIGPCHGGTHVCNAAGTDYGPCEGEALPTPETCLTGDDDDCDGAVNEDGDGCVCVPGSVAACYTGPDGTADVGVCSSGVKVCDDLGLSYGPCLGDVTPKQENCSTGTDDDCDGQTPACLPGEYVWAKLFNAGALDVASDSSGNFVVAAWLDGTVDLGGMTVTSAGPTLLVFKLDPDGNPVWATTVGAPTPQAMLAAGPNDDLVLVEKAGGPVVVQKLTSDGALSWTKTFQGAQFNGVGVDAQGAVVLGGQYQGTVDFGNGPVTSALVDGFLLKLDASGALVWSTILADPSGGRSIQGLSLDASGDIVGTGNGSGDLDVGGGPLIPSGSGGLFVGKWSAAGSHVWSRGYGFGGLPQYAYGIGAAPGAAAVAIGNASNIDMGGGELDGCFLAGFDAGGTCTWSKAFQGCAPPGKFVVDELGGLTIAGHNLVDFGGGQTWGATVVRLSPIGDFLWQNDFPPAYGLSAAVDPWGYVALLGWTLQPVDFGGGVLQLLGPNSGFIAKFAP